MSGSAAILGVILSRKFGHGVKTDGFFAAYGVYLAFVLVAGSLRVIVMPRFVAAERLAAEVSSWALGLAPVLALGAVVAIVWPHWIASALTSNAAAQDQAAQLLPWLVPAAVAQIYGGLVASALAALDDYAWAAFGFALGSIVSVVVTLALVDHGVVAFGWGLMVNGAVSLAVPLLALLARMRPAPPDGRAWGRLLELAEGVALPIALQGLYVVAYRYASGLGTGRATTFSYAYLIAAFLVSVTAASIALVTTVPFAREGMSPERSARHVLAISWLSLVPVAAACGVFALAGEGVVRRVLGSSYGGGTGAELGHLVVYLGPWIVASVALTVAYPLVFVRGRARWLPAVALAAIATQVLVEWLLQRWFHLSGVAAGLAVTTALVLAVLLVALNALGRVIRGLIVAAVVCGGVAAIAFAVPRLVLGDFAAAAAGLVLYTVVLAAWRPAGLRQAWAYVRALQ
ncbi:MAG TPA: hypothetical protein VGQ38_16585 [Gaiellaceae bacterium]|nr:hypothetical protein [Gaiellaceae bacterium]